ncbi:MAG TPA: hypothetical protein VFL83_05595 [Anaeromyxobacter sp.]|nr:hypothetical protein [Anaeromyxobacter sp.]
MLAIPILAAALAAAPAPARDDAGDAPDALRAIAALSAGDPTVAEVAAAADATAREAERGAAGAERWATRARLSALLPRLTAELRVDEQSYRVVGLQGSGEVDYQRRSPGTTVALRATWDLGELVAARGELAAAAVAAASARRRDAAVRRATALFFERRRAQLALLLDPPASPLARAEAELALDRLKAELDVLTGGLLSRGRR